jgi:segregation and condensation protein B
VTRKRKQQRANEAVPEEILAEGSHPHGHQDAEMLRMELAEAASEALDQDDQGDDGEVVFEAADQGEDDEQVAPDARKPKRKRRRKAVATEASDATEQASDDDAAEANDGAGAVQADAEDDDGGGHLEDSEVGPELEEAEVAAFRSAQSDEQLLVDAVMRAEAEAELGSAEPEATPDDDDDLGAALPTTAATMDDLQLKHLVEALIFAADKPVTLQRLRQLTRISDVKRLEAALAALAEDFADRGLALQQVSGGYQFRTNTQYSTWVQQLIAGRPVRLSRAQLETLAIVAYRQPVTRPEVDDIRGVDSSATLRLLMDRSLIRILGKKEEVGRPLLYGTTREFLDFFSLGDLRELPTLHEYSELTAESQQVISDRLGDADAAVESDHADAQLVEAMDVAVAPEPSVDDLVREFAQADLGATRASDRESDTSSDGTERADLGATSPSQPVASSEVDGDSDTSSGGDTGTDRTLDTSDGDASDEWDTGADHTVAEPDGDSADGDAALASLDGESADEGDAGADRTVAGSDGEVMTDEAGAGSEADETVANAGGDTADDIEGGSEETVAEPSAGSDNSGDDTDAGATMRSRESAAEALDSDDEPPAD